MLSRGGVIDDCPDVELAEETERDAGAPSAVALKRLPLCTHCGGQSG
jgi:hypothetical protein